METILGIDLGTTNSEVAYIRDGKVFVIEKDGRKLLPSVVGIDPQGKLLVGYPAKNQAVLFPERTIKSVKRLMGTDQKITLGDSSYSPSEISAMILRTLRSYAEEALGETFKKVVITVPAFFNDTQREATRLAGELAGLDVVRIINEPTAASLTYNSDTTGCETLLIYDLGGGTFDVSIVKIEDGVIEVLSSHGDTHLGGDDFDKLLFDNVCDTFKKKNKLDLRDSLTSSSRVLQAVEKAKIQLSSEPFATIKEEFIAEKGGEKLHLEIEISRDDYEEIITPLIEKTITCVGDALHDAKVQTSEIDKVVLVGGSSRTPLVQNMLANKIGKTVHGEVDPDLCVAMGAAVQGGLITGDNVGQILIDITPHTLGVSCLSVGSFGYETLQFSPIITRNTPVPCSRSEVYYTRSDNQESVITRVYQGESRDLDLDTQIGEFWLKGLSKVPAGNEIVCKFDLNADGILHVTATERSTGLSGNVTVENALAKQDAAVNDKFRKHLESFFEGSQSHPSNVSGDVIDIDSDEQNTKTNTEIQKKLSEAIKARYPDAGKVLRKSYEMAGKVTSEDDENEIQQLTVKLSEAMNSNNDDNVKKFTVQLEDLLFYLEDSV
ncbi:MAG: Hsp70 family protein [Planctomycetaceae bacterium]|jgi:molecular chaperone DnaK|nr:Hsp70 family protein [Planctomycetaceae bacterium]